MKLKFLYGLALLVTLTNCGKPDNRSYQGYIEGENIYLSSPNSGILKHLYVQRGEQVQQDQKLFALDADPQAIEIKQGEAELVQAQQLLHDLQKPRRTPEIAAIKAQIQQASAQLKLAEIRVKRYQELYNKKVVNKDTVDEFVSKYQELQQLKTQYESNLELAQLGSRDEQIKAQQAQIDALTAKLNEAKWQLTQKQIHAPAAGLIFDTYYREGEFVASQQPVLSLLTPDNIRIEFFIPLTELSRIHVGQKVTFVSEEETPVYHAVINYISPEAQYIPPLVYSRENSDKLVFRVKAAIANPAQFKPGQPVLVTIDGQ